MYLCMVSHDDMIHVRRMTFNFWHCCLGAEISVFFIALSCQLSAVKKNMRTVSSRRENKKCTTRAVKKKKKVPSLPVVEQIIYRPVPSWKFICTVPSRRAKKHIPSRSVVTIFTYRPVPSWQFLFTVPSPRPVMKQKGHCTVPSRPVEKIRTHRPVQSHPGNYIFHYFTVPSRLEYYQPWKKPWKFAEQCHTYPSAHYQVRKKDLEVIRKLVFRINERVTCGMYIILYSAGEKSWKNVSCEYDRLNGWNWTLQAAWYISCLLYTSDAADE